MEREAEEEFSADIEADLFVSSCALSEDEEALVAEELLTTLVIALGGSFEAT